MAPWKALPALAFRERANLYPAALLFLWLLHRRDLTRQTSSLQDSSWVYGSKDRSCLANLLAICIKGGRKYQDNFCYAVCL